MPLLSPAVLLVSSHPALARQVVRLLEQALASVQIEVATCGVEGLAQVYKSPPDVLVVDARLSDISGLQFCRVLKQDPIIYRLPLVMVTADDPQEYERFTELSPIADAFINGHDLAAELTPTIVALLQRYEGLDAAEREPLTLLRQSAMVTQPLTRMVQMFDQSITEISVLRGFQRLFDRVADKNVLSAMLFGLLENCIDYDLCMLFLNDTPPEGARLQCHTPHTLGVDDKVLADAAQRVSAQLAQYNVLSSQADPLKWDLMMSPSSTNEKSVSLPTMSFFPFLQPDGTLMGAIAFLNRKEHRYDMIFPFPLVLQELHTLARLRYFYAQRQLQTITDNLTQRYTYQYFVTCLEREIRQARRFDQPLSIAVLTVADLRAINRIGGPALGDQTLVHVAQSLSQCLRTTDIVARGGGGKLWILFPQATADDAQTALDRIADQLRMTPLAATTNRLMPITLWTGLATLDDTLNQSTLLLAEAENVLLAARQGLSP